SNLDRSQYFSRIRVAPLIREAQNATVPVDIELGLRPRHAWSSGLGFTTDTGPRARFSYENRFLNSRGHRLQAASSLSSIRAEVGGSYTVPLNHPLADSVIYSAQYIVEDDDVYKSKRLQAGISLPTENRWGWQQTISLDLQRDDYEFTNSDDVSILVLPGLSLSKSRADDFINPLHGWKLLASVKGASESLLSDNTFLQFYGSAKWIQGFGRFRLLARGELGATWIDQGRELPASLRYYAGGDQSVRGYDFRAIGPQDEEGNAQGGRQLAVSSFEVDYSIRDKWRLAVFTDAGSAFDNQGDLDPVYSAGIGLRWLSPIGPLRIDLAHPIDADESFRIHVTMGPDL
ncbi:MAG TPA: BamA/TamA family outer membrane protein, partial [Pseudomonadaceae bacterium]|nr:BamA/TamA family outer membrane protein [Pseudomonadaceae bacterium]